MLPAVKPLKCSFCPMFAPSLFKIIASAALFLCNYLCHSAEDGFLTGKLISQREWMMGSSKGESGELFFFYLEAAVMAAADMSATSFQDESKGLL